MSDRKHYSQRRQTDLIRVVQEAITEVQLMVLRGGIEGLSAIGRERAITAILDRLPMRIASAYRKSYAKEKP